MKTRRSLFINNTLVQGICNYDCITCGVNKPSYTGPKQYQTREITQKLIDRIKDAPADGIKIRFLGLSGIGEPTLHPEFVGRMQLFGRLLNDLKQMYKAPPEIAVLTNGYKLIEPDVLESIAGNLNSLLISFPTSNPHHYGEIMMQKPEMGKELLNKVIPGIEKAMSFKGQQRLSSLKFHISPPHEYIRPDFTETIDFLTELAKKHRMEEIQLVIFPAMSSRAGLVKNAQDRHDSYKDFFRKYHQKYNNGVGVSMIYGNNRIYKNIFEILDLMISFDYPCIAYGNLFITADGKSGCCNDQNAEDTRGDIIQHSLKEIMEIKERFLPSNVCKKCNNAPERQKGSFQHMLYRRATSLKLYYKKNIQRCSLQRS